MTDPVSPREALIARLRTMADGEEQRGYVDDATSLRDAADALESAEARAVAAEERIEAVRALHVPVETWCETATSEDGEWTERAMYDSDGTLVAAVDGVQVVCAVCAPRYGVPSPCPTAAALGAPLDPPAPVPATPEATTGDNDE